MIDSNLVLSVIRDFYMKQNAPVEIWKIYRVLRKFKPATIRDSIKYLHSQGRIIMEIGTMSVTPVITEAERPYMEEKTNHISETKIREAIRQFFKEKMYYPSSSEVKTKFIELFGVPEEKDVERAVRRMASENRIFRTNENRYHFKGMENQERTLRGY